MKCWALSEVCDAIIQEVNLSKKNIENVKLS